MTEVGGRLIATQYVREVQGKNVVLSKVGALTFDSYTFSSRLTKPFLCNCACFYSDVVIECLYVVEKYCAVLLYYITIITCNFSGI